VRPGETLGIVGESGSGKTIHVLAMLGLLPAPPGRVAAGEVIFAGQDLLRLSPSALRDVRGGQIGIIFQDPMAALNPVLTVGRQIAEPLRRHKGLSRRQALARAEELLAMVGIPDPRRRLSQFPHEFSGGMRQRVMIAIAVACEPRLLIADEPTTALDVTVQAQILELVSGLQRRLGMTMIWITHDIGVVAGLADRVQVMYGGRIMERGPVRDVFRTPRSAYTWSLLRALPHAERAAHGRLQQIPGVPPDPFDPPPGDPFAPRNPFATERCFREPPPLRPVPGGAPDHLVAAWYDLPTALQAATPA
jgi:peptide/nickel transport system ATP-binding protein/oligopeptide transport system ATP-binding protein